MIILSKCHFCGDKINSGDKFCSRQCSSENRVIRIEVNCAFCSKLFSKKPSVKKRYCSNKCFYDHIRKPKKELLLKLEHLSKCLWCNLDFKNSPRSRKRYCSSSCVFEYNQSKSEILSCGFCSKEFKAFKSQNKKYCSKLCSQKGQVTKIEKLCGTCDNKFSTHISTNKKYCSKQCYLLKPRKIKIRQVQVKKIRISTRISKQCASCSAIFSHLPSKKRTHCSTSCMATAYKTKLLKDKNPNFGNRGKIAQAVLRGCYDNRPLPKFSLGKICEYKGFTMRSSWEYEYAKYLDNLGIKWEYEQKRFKLSSGKLYIPDFYLPDQDKYVEIKGHWFPKAIEKFKIFKEEYPHINLEVIDKEIWKN